MMTINSDIGKVKRDFNNSEFDREITPSDYERAANSIYKKVKDRGFRGLLYMPMEAGAIDSVCL